VGSKTAVGLTEKNSSLDPPDRLCMGLFFFGDSIQVFKTRKQGKRIISLHVETNG